MSRYALLLSVTPPLGPPPHIHSAHIHNIKLTKQTKLTVRGCYVPPRGEMALAPTSRQRPLHLFPFYSQESHEFSHMLKVLLIDGAEIGSL